MSAPASCRWCDERGTFVVNAVGATDVEVACRAHLARAVEVHLPAAVEVRRSGATI